MISVILVAAGKGLRMKSETPKQFIEINGMSILEHSLNAFIKAIPKVHICLVLHQDYLDKGEKLKAKYPHCNITFLSGGKERFHSVQNAINTLDERTEIVMIHDAVRPFCSAELIQKCLEMCRKNGNAIPAIRPKDSLRMIDENGMNKHVDRSNFRIIQTPQCFDYQKIKNAYLQVHSGQFTDDASVVEASGEQIYLVEGDTKNIKITSPEDLAWASQQ